MLIIFQVFFILFSLYAVSSVVQKRKNSELGPKGVFFWIAFWIIADVGIFMPKEITVIANHVGIGRGTDFVLYISFVIIFFVLFRLHIKLEGLNRDLTKMVRSDALKHEGDKKL